MKKLDDAISLLKEIEKDFHGYGRWSANAREAIKLIESYKHENCNSVKIDSKTLS